MTTLPFRAAARLLAVATMAGGLAALGPVPAAQAAAGDRLVFTGAADGLYEVFTANPDGSGLTQLTSGTHASNAAWSPDGRISFTGVGSGGFDTYDVHVVNADGTGLTKLTNTGDAFGASWSPDGSRIAFVREVNHDRELFMMNADGSAMKQLTNAAAWESYGPSWSPDGTRIAFTREDADLHSVAADIWVMNADGSGLTRLTTTGQDSQPDWSPDGQRLVFTHDPEDAFSDVWVMAADGSDRRRLTTHPGYDSAPSWSPDGSTIAFMSSRLGTHRVHLMAPDGTGQTALSIALSPTLGPDWRPLPAVSIQDATVSEGTSSGSATVAVRLNRPHTVPVSVSVTTSGGSATAGADYQPVSKAVTIPAGTTQATFTIPILDDSVDEPNETIGVRIDGVTNALAARRNGFVYLHDDDEPPAGLISIDDVKIAELPPIWITAHPVVRLSGPVAHTVTVTYATADGSATAGEDYAARSGTLAFPPGSTAQAIAIPVASDGDADPSESFVVNLGPAVGGKIVDAQGVVSLKDCQAACPG